MTALDEDDFARIQATDDMILERRLRALLTVQLRQGSRVFLVEASRRRPADLTPRERHRVATLAWEHRRRLPPGVAPRINPRDPLSPEQAALHAGCPPTLAQARAEAKAA